MHALWDLADVHPGFHAAIIIQDYNFYLHNGNLPAGSEMDIKSNSRFIKIKIKTKRKRIRTKLYR